MNRKKRLIFRILNLLELIETPKNQPTVNQIRGLLYCLFEEEN